MRERIYAYYIGYVAAFIIFISMFSGSYLSCGFNGWPQGLHTIGTAVLAFMTLFSSEFLQLKSIFLKIVISSIYLPSFLLFLAIPISQGVPHVTLAFNIFSAFLVTLLFILAIRTWILGYIRAHYYLIALIIYMPTMGLMVLTFNALLVNNDFTRYSFLFGALAEIIFFSLIPARIHTAKYDEIRLQKELLKEKQKNEAFLEHEVEKQRQELKEKNAILFHQSRHAAMGEMISMIAHQWRQPLNTLALINQNLYFKYKLGKCDETCIEQAHQQFDEHLQYMSKTIDDFRDYYKNDTVKKPEAMGEIAQLALNLSDFFLNYAKIKTQLIVTTDEKINLAKNEMLQVLMNLIKNSHDAIVERHISSGKITITVEKKGGSIYVVSVIMAGGISDDIAKKRYLSPISPPRPTMEQG